MSRSTDALEGSAWTFCGAGATVTFEEGRHLQMKGREFSCRGSWTREGDHIVFDCNGFTTYDVHVDGSKMSGKWFRTKDPKVGAKTCLSRIDAK